jgi:hypothetical protein
VKQVERELGVRYELEATASLAMNTFDSETLQLSHPYTKSLSHAGM